jgi:hypothetical protein
MALANNTDLKAAVADWLADTTLTSQIVDFVTLCEKELNRELRVRRMQTTTTWGLATSSYTHSWPSDMLALVRGPSLRGSPPTQLIYKTPAQLVELDDGAAGTPKYWGDVGGELYVVPFTDTTTHTASIVYFKALDIATTTTNWALTNHPDLYLYGTLRQAAPYLVEDQRAAQWEQKYQAALEGVKDEDRRFQAPQAVWVTPDNGGP